MAPSELQQTAVPVAKSEVLPAAKSEVLPVAKSEVPPVAKSEVLPVANVEAAAIAAPPVEASLVSPSVSLAQRTVPARATESVARTPLFNRQLFVIVTLLLGVQLALLVGNLWFQFHNYAIGIALAEKAGSGADTVSLILIYSRAWDFAVTKTSALFLGFLVIYTGALYVLYSADTTYEVSFNQGPQPGATLKSSSPGLVMVTLGSVLVALVLFSKSEVGLQVSTGPATAEGSATTLTATTATTAPALAPAAPAAAPPAKVAAPAHPGAASPEDSRMPKLLDPH
jgi:hypothetical protein